MIKQMFRDANYFYSKTAQDIVCLLDVVLSDRRSGKYNTFWAVIMTVKVGKRNWILYNRERSKNHYKICQESQHA